MASISQIILKSYVKTNHIEICKHRSKCRICNDVILYDSVRFSEMYPHPMKRHDFQYYHYHMECAASCMPECFIERLDTNGIDFRNIIPDVILGLQYPRLAEIYDVRRATNGVMECKECNTRIKQDGYLVHLKKFQNGQWNDRGFIHIGCLQKYTKITDASYSEKIRKYLQGKANAIDSSVNT